MMQTLQDLARDPSIKEATVAYKKKNAAGEHVVALIFTSQLP